MAEVAGAEPLFEGALRRPRERGRRLAFLAASAVLQAGALALLLSRPGPTRVRPAEPVVAVQLLRTPLRAPPPPAAALPAPRRAAPVAERRPERMTNPRELPAVPRPAAAIPDPVPEPPVSVAPGEAAHEAGAGEGGTGTATGHPDGVVGGVPGGLVSPVVQQAPPPPAPARPRDLAAVRAGIARTLVYPPHARRNGLGGRVVLAFVLLADGHVRDLAVRSGSGLAVLDDAAVAAVRDAAPFPPPGVDVLVVVPVAFRAD